MLIKHSLLYFIALALPGLVNLLALSLYTRLLTPESYGEYALLIAGVGFINAALFQWLRLGLLRFLSAHKGHEKSFLSSILAGYCGVLIVTSLGCLVSLFFIHTTEMRIFLGLGLLLLWVQAFFEINLELVRSQYSPHRYGLLGLAKAVIALVVGVGLVYSGFGAYGLAVGGLVGMVVALIWQMNNNWVGVRFGLTDKKVFRQLFNYGIPLTATSMMSFVVGSSDRFLLAGYLSSNDAGLYSVGYDFTKQTLVMLMMVVNLAAYPLAVRALEQEGLASARRQLSNNAVLLTSIAFPTAAGFAILAPNITSVFLGESFQQSASELMPWIALATLLSGLKAYYLDLSFQLGKKTVKQLWITILAAGLNVLLNLVWIPSYGLMGAAYSTVCAYLLGFVLSLYWGRYVFKLPFPGRDLLKIVFATGVMALALSPLIHQRGTLALAGQVLWGGIVFGLVYLVLNIGDMRNVVNRNWISLWRRGT